MPVLFTCPKTNRQAPTRVHMDAKSLRLAWKKTLRVLCPHCGEQHKVSVRDAFLESALRDHSIGRCSTGSLLLCRPY